MGYSPRGHKELHMIEQVTLLLSSVRTAEGPRWIPGWRPCKLHCSAKIELTQTFKFHPHFVLWGISLTFFFVCLFLRVQHSSLSISRGFLK